jgi:hypothetical protein
MFAATEMCYFWSQIFNFAEYMIVWVESDCGLMALHKELVSVPLSQDILEGFGSVGYKQLRSTDHFVLPAVNQIRTSLMKQQFIVTH